MAKAHPSKLVRLGSHTFRLSLVEFGKLTEEKGGKAAPAKPKRRRKAKASKVRKAPRKASRRTRRK